MKPSLTPIYYVGLSSEGQHFVFACAMGTNMARAPASPSCRFNIVRIVSTLTGCDTLLMRTRRWAAVKFLDNKKQECWLRLDFLSDNGCVLHQLQY